MPPTYLKNQNFIIPNYNFIDSVKYRIGLGLYDYLSGNLSLGKTIAISKNTTMQRLPTLNGAD